MARRCVPRRSVPDPAVAGYRAGRASLGVNGRGWIRPVLGCGATARAGAQVDHRVVVAVSGRRGGSPGRRLGSCRGTGRLGWWHARLTPRTCPPCRRDRTGRCRRAGRRAVLFERPWRRSGGTVPSAGTVPSGSTGSSSSAGSGDCAGLPRGAGPRARATGGRSRVRLRRPPGGGLRRPSRRRLRRPSHGVGSGAVGGRCFGPGPPGRRAGGNRVRGQSTATSAARRPPRADPDPTRGRRPGGGISRRRGGRPGPGHGRRPLTGRAVTRPAAGGAFPALRRGAVLRRLGRRSRGCHRPRDRSPRDLP